VPAGGITKVVLSFRGDVSDSGLEQMREVVKAYADWAVGLDARWSGSGGVYPDPESRGLRWVFAFFYFFLGGADEINFQDVPFTHNVTHYEDAWSVAKASSGYSTPPYSPAPLLNSSFPYWKGWESAFIDKATTKDRFPEHVVSTLLEKGSVVPINHDIPDGSTEPADATSISKAFREAALLLEYPGSEDLSPYAYFSESPYDMAGTSWQERYWGEGRYQKLLSIKNRFDPQGLLWCHHCVGSEDEDVEAADRRRLGDVLV
jgi:ribonuclease T2